MPLLISAWPRPVTFGVPLLITGLVALGASGALATGPGQEVVGWRSDGTGHYPDANPPVEWDGAEKVIWKTNLGSWSNSTPTVVGDKIFVNSEPFELICLDRTTGKKLWSADHDYAKMGIEGPPPKTHDANGWSTPTGISDGTHIYASFGNGIAACYDLNGKKRWIRRVDTPTRRWGHSTTPVLSGGHLIVCINRLIGLNAETGEEDWSIDSEPSWGSPLGFTFANTAAVATCDGQIVRSEDGVVLADGLGKLGYNTPLIHENILYYMTGDAKAYKLPTSLPAAVANGKEKLGLEPIWESKLRRDRYYSSPLIHDGRIYSITRGSIMTVVDAKTGKKAWEARIGAESSEVEDEPAPRAEGRPQRGARGERPSGADGRERRRRSRGRGSRGSGGGDTMYSSFSLAGGLIYLTSEKGRCFVFRPGDKFDLVVENKVPGTMRACLVFDGPRILVRAGKSLLSIGEQDF